MIDFAFIGPNGPLSKLARMLAHQSSSKADTEPTRKQERPRMLTDIVDMATNAGHAFHTELAEVKATQEQDTFADEHNKQYALKTIESAKALILRRTLDGYPHVTMETEGPVQQGILEVFLKSAGLAYHASVAPRERDPVIRARLPMHYGDIVVELPKPHVQA